MVSPLEYKRCGTGRRRRAAWVFQLAAAILLALPQLLTAENPATVLPDLDGNPPDVLPEVDLPFLAVPYESADALPGQVEEPIYELPPVERFLPPRAVAVPVLRLSGFHFEGNTVFGDEELAALLDHFRGRELPREDLDQLRFEITRHYVSNGYLNSGASLPEQDFRYGILRILITEGHLTDVIAYGNKGLSDRYLTTRILIDRDRPLHFPTVQKRLQVLQGNENITRLNAELKPGLVPGEALMVVEVGESPPWSYGMDINNQRSPSVGGEQLDVWFENSNLTGVSDLLQARLGLLSGDPDGVHFNGLDNGSAQYRRPLAADDTTLVLGVLAEDYSILEEPFRSLAIEGESHSLFAGLRRPLHRSLRDELWISLMLECSHDQTEVLGRPISVSPGSVDGELDLTLIRLGVDWTRRSLRSAFSNRSVLSLGINALGATDQLSEPDGRFVTWLSESQYSHRLDETGSLLVAHAGLGLSSDPLPPPAQFRLGGRYTVRGYRENFVVRDNGICAGLDFRFPVLGGGKEDEWSFWLVPFLDGGTAWNDGTAASESLLAAGIGVVAEYSDWFYGELFWGIPFINRDVSSDDLQDEGIHFRLSVAQF